MEIWRTSSKGSKYRHLYSLLDSIQTNIEPRPLLPLLVIVKTDSRAQNIRDQRPGSICWFTPGTLQRMAFHLYHNSSRPHPIFYELPHNTLIDVLPFLLIRTYRYKPIYRCIYMYNDAAFQPMHNTFSCCLSPLTLKLIHLQK